MGAGIIVTDVSTYADRVKLSRYHVQCLINLAKTATHQGRTAREYAALLEFDEDLHRLLLAINFHCLGLRLQFLFGHRNQVVTRL